MTTGEKIRAAREAAGMTQAQFAREIGIESPWGQSIVARYESGDRPIPRKRLKLAAEALGISILDLL